LYVVYILECSDGTYYAGYSNDLDARLDRHSAGKASRYTRSRLPVRLVYQEEHRTRTGAMKREYQLKRLARAKKQALIDEANAAPK